MDKVLLFLSKRIPQIQTTLRAVLLSISRHYRAVCKRLISHGTGMQMQLTTMSAMYVRANLTRKRLILPDSPVHRRRCGAKWKIPDLTSQMFFIYLKKNDFEL